MKTYLQNSKTGEIRIHTTHQANHPDMEHISPDEAEKILASRVRGKAQRQKIILKAAANAQKDRDAVTREAEDAAAASLEILEQETEKQTLIRQAGEQAQIDKAAELEAAEKTEAQERIQKQVEAKRAAAAKKKAATAAAAAKKKAEAE